MCVAFLLLQRSDQSNLQFELLSPSALSIRQGRNQLLRLFNVFHRLVKRGTRTVALARNKEIVQRLDYVGRNKLRVPIMICKQFRLILDDLWEILLQGPSNRNVQP